LIALALATWLALSSQNGSRASGITHSSKSANSANATGTITRNGTLPNSQSIAPQSTALIDRAELFRLASKSKPGNSVAFGEHRWDSKRMRQSTVAEAAILAPPLPFTYLGKQEERGLWRVFLGHQGSTLVVEAGDLLADNYQVVEIAPSQMTLTYLPLNEKQTLLLE
jgi:hypothetical protein